MAGTQAVLSILDEAAAAIGGWTALQSIRCVHWDAEGQDWEPWQAYDTGGTLDVSTFRVATDLDLAKLMTSTPNNPTGPFRRTGTGSQETRCLSLTRQSDIRMRIFSV